MTVSPRWIDPSLYDSAEVVAAFDDLSLWSAPFGLMLLDTVRLRGVRAALDVGCGAGFPLLELADRLGPGCRVVGVDPWAAAMARAQAKAAARGLGNVELVIGKVEELGFADATFDLVVSNNGLNNVADTPRALAGCARVSRPGAQLVLTANLPASMRELYDVYEAVLRERGREDLLAALAAHIDAKRKPVATLVRWIEAAGYGEVTVQEQAFRLRFADGTALFRHWFMRLGFIGAWASVLPAAEVGPVLDAIEARLNELGARGEVALSVPFACLSATRWRDAGDPIPEKDDDRVCSGGAGAPRGVLGAAAHGVRYSLRSGAGRAQQAPARAGAAHRGLRRREGGRLGGRLSLRDDDAGGHGGDERADHGGGAGDAPAARHPDAHDAPAPRGGARPRAAGVGAVGQRGLDYGRYGYGLASLNGVMSLERERAVFKRPASQEGVLRLLDENEAREPFRDVYERLRPSVPGMLIWQALPAKDDAIAVLKMFFGRELLQEVFAHCDGETGIAAFHRVADAIALRFVEEQHLVRFGDRVVASQMAHVDASVREDQVRGARALFGALVATAAVAGYIANSDDLRVQQILDDEARHDPSRCSGGKPKLRLENVVSKSTSAPGGRGFVQITFSRQVPLWGMESSYGLRCRCDGPRSARRRARDA